MQGNKSTPRLPSWQFGPDWPGERCGAKTRQGATCLNAAMKGRHRCRMHGGKGGAPSGERNGNYKDGRHTKERLQAERESAARVRELYRQARDAGLFDTNRPRLEFMEEEDPGAPRFGPDVFCEP